MEKGLKTSLESTEVKASINHCQNMKSPLKDAFGILVDAMIEQKGKPSGLIHAVQMMQCTDMAVGKARSEEGTSVMPIKKWLDASTN